MRSFIPSIEEPPESDDSGDEIPPGGIFHAGVLNDQSDSDDNNDDNDNNDGDGLNLPGDDTADNGEGPAVNDEDDHSVYSISGDSNDSEDGDTNDADIEGHDDDSDSDRSSSSEASATIEDIFGVKPAIEAQRDHPPDLEADSGIVDLCFHPSIDLLSAATMDGEAVIYRYSREEVEEVTRFSHHKKSCRVVRYSEDGTRLFTISKDKSFAVIDTQNSAVIQHTRDAHEAPIYSFFVIDENICATGDDDGTVKLWDLRKRKSLSTFKPGEQTVMSLISDSAKKYLVASVSDGSIAGINVRTKQMEMQSELYGSEMTSMTLVRDDSRLVVGSGEGTLFIYKWGQFGFHIDRFSGHPNQIQCIVPITDRMLLTGCEDGNIRAVHLYQHRFVGIVGQHKDFGVENMSVSSDGTLLASCAMDEVVRFWNIDYLYGTTVDGRKKGNKKKGRNHNLESSKHRNRYEFYNDYPEKMESDDEGGPVAGPSHTMD